MNILQDIMIYLLAMVIAVPLANRLGLGSVLGYLIAGIVIGPVLGLVGSETEDLQRYGEFGVVMMLFLVGLELEPAILWKMRSRLIGLGGAQVLLTAMVLWAVIHFGLNQPWQSALALGFALALSSTAIVLQSLNEKGWLKSEGGQSAFSVLLFQDIAVIPLIAFMPLLAVYQARYGHSEEAAHGSESLISAWPIGAQALAIFLVIASIIVGGYYLSRPVFRYISFARLREIYTAAALLLIVTIAVLMGAVGLSPALGAFLAGVVLSSSEYRHELQSDLEPFKGLLLGLFFITVGAGINFSLIAREPGFIFGFTLLLMFIKFLVLMALAFVFKMQVADRWLFALSLAQAGEFGFVLMSIASGEGVISAGIEARLTLVVAISMVLTPLLFIIYERLIAPRVNRTPIREADEVDSKGTIIIAGMGRFGQVVARLLLNNGYECVMFDHDIEQIELFRRLGIRAYFGDATRPELLHAAGIDDAKLFVASLEDKERQRQLVSYLHREYPDLKVVARAYDRGHYYELKEAGADVVEREAFEGALALGRKSMIALGEHPYQALQLTNKFRDFDVKRMIAMGEHWTKAGLNEDDTLEFARRMLDEQEALMRRDRLASRRGGRGWAAPKSPRDEPASDEAKAADEPSPAPKEPEDKAEPTPSSSD